MTDAAHLLSDMAGFFISLFALWLAGFPPSQHMSFGYRRAGCDLLCAICDELKLQSLTERRTRHLAEIIGATLSVFLIWLLTGILVYEAVLRVMTPEQLDGRLMFITATLGFGANIVYVEQMSSVEDRYRQR